MDERPTVEVSSVLGTPAGRVREHMIPLDRHSLRIDSFRSDPDGGGGFVEESTSWLQRRWRHERRLEALGGSCRVTDRVTDPGTRRTT